MPFGVHVAFQTAFRPCVVLQPQSHTIALNLVHAYECVARWQDAYDVAVRYLTDNLAATIGPVSNADIVRELRSVSARCVRQGLHVLVWRMVGDGCPLLQSSRGHLQLKSVLQFSASAVDDGVDVASLPQPAARLDVEWLAPDPPYAKVTDAATGRRE